MNLFEHINDVLKCNNRSICEINWIGCKDFQINKELFLEFTKKLKYNESLNLRYNESFLKLPYDLLMVGNDFWLEISDDADELVYREIPHKPLQLINLKYFSTSLINLDEEKSLCLDNKNLYSKINSGHNTLEALSQYTAYKCNKPLSDN